MYDQHFAEALRAAGVSEDAPFETSSWDLARRTYLLADRVVKVRLTRHDDQSLRHNTLIQEAEVLRNLELVKATPRVLRTVDGGRFELLELSRLAGTPLPQQRRSLIRALTVSLRLLTVLIDLSRHGIAHNDVAPGNVLVDHRGRIALIDFDQASTTSSWAALARNLVGISRTGTPTVHASWLTFLPRWLLDQLPPELTTWLRRLKERLRPRRPPPPERFENPELRQLATAWSRAARSDASAPGLEVCYYSVTYRGVHFPGERPWEPRWEQLRTAVPLEGRRILELGCNLGLLSTWSMRFAGAEAAMGVDHDAEVVGAAAEVAAAVGVPARFSVIDLDGTDSWEDELTSFNADILFVLNVMQWVNDKDRLAAFIRRYDTVVYEGHEHLEVEIARLGETTFQSITQIGVTERRRPLLLLERRPSPPQAAG